MKRLTSKRCSGIKSGYWTACKKDELVQRLGEYEDSGLMPEDVWALKRAVGWKGVWDSEKARRLQAFEDQGFEPEDIGKLWEHFCEVGQFYAVEDGDEKTE